MKKALLVLAIVALIGAFTVGCSPEFYKHDSVFKNWDHIKFSWGIGKCDENTIAQSNEEGWWGKETTCEEHASMWDSGE